MLRESPPHNTFIGSEGSIDADDSIRPAAVSATSRVTARPAAAAVAVAALAVVPVPASVVSANAT
jgi:hypothetical protein